MKEAPPNATANLGAARSSGPARLAACLALPALVLGAGCGEYEIQTYRAPKGAVTEASAAPQSTETAAENREGASRTGRPDWAVPEGWRRVESESAMRAATFEAGGGDASEVEIAVTALSGRAGGVRPNVNRWRRQIGLEPLSQKAIEQGLSRFEAGAREGYFVDMVGPEKRERNRVVGAILPGAQRTWFVKARAPAEALDPHLDALRAFARSFRPRKRDEGGEMPGQRTAQGESAAPSGGEGPPKPSWTKPKAWRAADEHARFAVATFKVAREDRSARVTVTPLPGDGGGALQNINRWRQQLGRAPVESLGQQPVTRLDDEGPRGALVDIAAEGDAPDRKRMLVAMLITRSHTWFVKMRGPSALLEAERARFRRFVESMRFGDNASEKEAATP
jgi:hypothetical protein